MQAFFVPSVIACALAQQLHVPLLKQRTIYEIRERPSRMYHWSTFLTAQILVELPWNIFGSTLLFIGWYWTIGFETSRAGYTYLFFGIVFPIYYTTLALAVSCVASSEFCDIIFVDAEKNKI
jgi:ATP-binding cassette, subfamily G (WHITE), member 2, SNQ2